MQVDVHLLTLSSMLFLIKPVKLCFITNVLKKEQAENFTVYYEKNKEFFVCNTFKNFVQYKIGFMDFFFHHNIMARLEVWKNVNTGIWF